MYEVTIAALFVVFFSISDNYVGEVIGCRTRKLFMNNMFFKHISLIFFIYFAVNLTNQEHEHPLVNLRNTFILWILYIIFIRMDTVYLGICIAILVAFYMLENYKLYLQYHVKDEYEKHIETYNQVSEILKIIILFPLSIGFYKYYKQEKGIYGKDLSIKKFILGHKKCK
jgi:hypothetical protein